jgi:hypothetical protein
VFSPYKALNTERPSSSFADISAYAMLAFDSDFKHNYTITISIFKYIGLLMIVLCGINFLRKFKTENYYLSFLVQLFTVIILVYSHRFLPWYLMVMPLFMYSENMKNWIKWFFVILFFSTFQDFAIFLSTDNIIGQIIMAAATILTVLSFFYLFKSRYLNLSKNEN